MVPKPRTLVCRQLDSSRTIWNDIVPKPSRRTAVAALKQGSENRPNSDQFAYQIGERGGGGDLEKVSENLLQK